MGSRQLWTEGPPPGFDFLRREYVVSEDIRGLAMVADTGDGGLCAARAGQRPIGLAPGGGWTAGQTVTFPDDFIFKTSFVVPDTEAVSEALTIGGAS